MRETPSQSEQRRARRQGFVTFVWYKRIYPQSTTDTSDEEGLARSCDISDGGLGLVTSRPLQSGARIFVEVVTKVGSLSMIAGVTHCRAQDDGSFRIGLEVQIVPPNDRDTLKMLLSP